MEVYTKAGPLLEVEGIRQRLHKHSSLFLFVTLSLRTTTNWLNLSLVSLTFSSADVAQGFKHIVQRKLIPVMGTNSQTTLYQKHK